MNLFDINDIQVSIQGLEDGGLEALLKRMNDSNNDSEFFIGEELPDGFFDDASNKNTDDKENNLNLPFKNNKGSSGKDIDRRVVCTFSDKKRSLNGVKDFISYTIKEMFNDVVSGGLPYLEVDIVDDISVVCLISSDDELVFLIPLVYSIAKKIGNKNLIKIEGISTCTTIRTSIKDNKKKYYFAVSMDSFNEQLKEKYINLLTDILVYIGNVYRRHGKLSSNKFFKMFDMLKCN